jgi:hypothetical protein
MCSIPVLMEHAVDSIYLIQESFVMDHRLLFALLPGDQGPRGLICTSKLLTGLCLRDSFHHILF